MKNLLKRILYSTVFRVGSVRTVFRGPCRGIKYRIFPNFGLAYFFGRWEPAEIRTVSRIVRPGAVVYDLGANFGMYTLFLSRLVGPAGKVFSFEPVPSIIRDLTANVDLNGFTNVAIVPMAAALSSGIMSFARSDSVATGHLVSEDSSEDALNVKATSIDDFVLRDGREPPDFIKIDVEGAEGEVLAGAREVVSRYRPVMMIELHTPEADLAVGKFLSGLGYSAIRTETGEKVEEITSCWPNPRGLWGTVLATPNRDPCVLQRSAIP